MYGGHDFATQFSGLALPSGTPGRNGLRQPGLETRVTIAFSGGHVYVIDRWEIENGNSG